MPVLWLIVLLISNITLASAADSARTRALPLLEETGDADKKADYLESIPYRPCPSAVFRPHPPHRRAHHEAHQTPLGHTRVAVCRQGGRLP